MSVKPRFFLAGVLFGILVGVIIQLLLPVYYGLGMSTLSFATEGDPTLKPLPILSHDELAVLNQNLQSVLRSGMQETYRYGFVVPGMNGSYDIFLFDLGPRIRWKDRRWRDMEEVIAYIRKELRPLRKLSDLNESDWGQLLTLDADDAMD